MFDLRKIPLLRVLVPFFGGVMSGIHLSLKIQIHLVIMLLLFFLGMAVVFYRWQCHRPELPRWLNVPLLFLLFYIAGAGSGTLTRPIDPGLPVNKLVMVRGELLASPSPQSYAHTFDLQIHLLSSGDSIYRTSTILKAYLSTPADSHVPEGGEIWQFSGKLYPIRNSGNPGTPDYRSIMGRKNCWYRFYIDCDGAESMFNRELQESDSRLSPSSFRRRISDHWQGDLEEVSLLKAVCLGDRSSLTDDMRQAYSTAGGMHLLAVSGLHVGLIWWTLQYMTAWLSLIFRKGRQQTVLVLALLWLYAFLTGFSSSVCRSVCMFSFFSLGRLLGERLHPLNAIFVSAFLLVMIDPQRLMDVGFQLSFTAITGIVTLHPLCMKLAGVKNRILRWVWEATSVSLAAQISTAPLVIFYFHQLPVYSLVTSLLAIPVLSLLIAIFVSSVPFMEAGLLTDFFNFLLVGLASLMNRFMDLLSSLPAAVLDDLHLNRAKLLAWLLILVLAIIFLHGRRRIPVFLLMLLVSVTMAWNSLSALKRRSSSELVISHFRGASMITFREGKKVNHYCWYSDSTSRFYMKAFRDAYWSRRIFKNQLYEPEKSQQYTGSISACIPLAEGAWCLGGGACGGLLLSHGVNPGIWEAALADSMQDQVWRPDFILLSGEPHLDLTHQDMWMSDAVLVIDGSNRSKFQERIAGKLDRVYLTDRSGAYMKRW